MRDEIMEDEVFALLRSEGPLDVSQICVERLLDPKQVIRALKSLQMKGVVTVRPDLGREVSDNELLVVWGLPTL